MKTEFEIGKEYVVDKQKAIYFGETNHRKFFLSVEGGKITEHTLDLEGKVERKTYREGPHYDMLMNNLEEVYK